MKHMLQELPPYIRGQVEALLSYANRRYCAYCAALIRLPQDPKAISFWVLNAVWIVTANKMEVVPLCVTCLRKLKLGQFDAETVVIRVRNQLNS
jgi:hypothetical protein